MDYGTGERVEYNRIVELEDITTGNKWHCTVVEHLTIENHLNMISTTPVCEKGTIWVHTPLGGAILGKKKNEIISYYVYGKQKQCKILKIYS